MDPAERNGIYSGAIGPLSEGIEAAPQVEPDSEAAQALEELADPQRLQPEDLSQIKELLAEFERS